MLIGDRAQLFLHSEDYFPNNDQSAKRGWYDNPAYKKSLKKLCILCFSGKEMFFISPPN